MANEFTASVQQSYAMGRKFAAPMAKTSRFSLASVAMTMVLSILSLVTIIYFLCRIGMQTSFFFIVGANQFR